MSETVAAHVDIPSDASLRLQGEKVRAIDKINETVQGRAQQDALRHQRLLELEAMISDACSTASGPASVRASTPRSCSRPPSAGSRSNASSRCPPRPASARPSIGRPASARTSSDRPASARPGTATSSGSGSSSVSAYSIQMPSCLGSEASNEMSRPSSRQGLERPGSAQPPSGVVGSQLSRPSSRQQLSTPRAASERDPEFQGLCDLIGEKAASRFKNVQSAFRHMDADKNGILERSEVHELFRAFNLPPEYADRFFDHLDLNGNNEIDYSEVTAIIGPYIQTGYKAPSTRGYSRAAPSSETPRPLSTNNDKGASNDPALNAARGRSHELQQLCQVVGAKAHQKYKNVTDCFRFLDDDKTGRINRIKCRRFMEVFGFPASVGDHVFDLLLDDGSVSSNGAEEIDFLRFVDTFGPFVQPGYSQKPSAWHRRIAPDVVRRSSTPPPEIAQERPKASHGRRRPQSARYHRHVSRPTSAAQLVHFKSGASIIQDCHEARSIGSASSASRHTCSAPSDDNSSDHVVDEQDVGSVAGSNAPVQTTAKMQLLENQAARSRSEVLAGPRGRICYMPEQPRMLNHGTWDSSMVKKRLGGQNAADPHRCSQTSRMHGYSGKAIKNIRAASPKAPLVPTIPVDAPKPRPPTGVATGFKRGKRPPQQRELVGSLKRLQEEAKHMQSEIQFAQEKAGMNESWDDRSTAPGTPHETFTRTASKTRAVHKDHRGGLVRDCGFTNSTPSLADSLEQRWSLL